MKWDHPTTHPLTQCEVNTKHVHYHNRSYSKEFRCPVCLVPKRLNTNFLGIRAPFCDGGSAWIKLETRNQCRRYDA